MAGQQNVQSKVSEQSIRSGAEAFMPLVRQIAGTLHPKLPRSVQIDDLVQYGAIGLMRAFQLFDPTRGVKFETYAKLPIRGAMLDGLRKEDWVPRLARARGEQAPQMLSLSSLVSSDGARHLTDVEDPGDGIVGSDNFNRLLLALPKRYRRLVALYYAGDLTMKEIGIEVGLSESRVSQLLSEALRILKSRVSMDEQTSELLDVRVLEPKCESPPQDETTICEATEPVKVEHERPFVCDQLPDRRFSATEAAKAAGVSHRNNVYYAVKNGRPMGPKRLTFRRDGGEAPSKPNPVEPFRQLVCDQLPGQRFSVEEAAKEAGVSKPTIYNALRSGRPLSGGLVFRRDDSPYEASRAATRRVSENLRPDRRSGSAALVSLAEMKRQLAEKMEAEIATVKERYARDFAAIEHVESLAELNG